MRIWLNGEVLTSLQNSLISVNDRGFLLGDGIFETIKIVKNQPILLPRHLRRLAASADRLGLAIPSNATIIAAFEELLATPIELGRARITLTAAPGASGLARVGTETNLLVQISEISQPLLATAKLALLPWSRNAQGAAVGLKSTSALENVLGLKFAHELGADEGLFANQDGAICEGTWSNIFYVISGEVFTPELITGCLPGITRELVLETISVKQNRAQIATLLAADEIFLTSSIQEILPVVGYAGKEFPIGPVTRDLQQCWSSAVAAEDI